MSLTLQKIILFVLKNRAKFPSDIVSFIIQKKLFGIVCLYLDIIELIN